MTIVIAEDEGQETESPTNESPPGDRSVEDTATFVRRLTVWAVIVAVFLPLVALIIWSFAFRWLFPDLLPDSWSLEAWDYVASDNSKVLSSLWTSVTLGLLVCVMALAVGLPASRALGLHEFRGKAAVELFLMAPIVVPPLVSVMGIHVTFIRLGLTGSYLGVALVHLIPSIPYFVLVMAGVFANYGTELEDTARTLGAGPIRVFLLVTLPAIIPGLSVALMFTFLISWGQYLTTLLIGSGRVTTLPIVLFPLLTGPNKASAAAVSLVLIVPALIALFLTSRQLGRDSTTLGGFGRL